ncbi:MAG: methionyl-tRNA formyltransferase [Mariprofundaceae bacterium]|nr:methionyl-tRNA formyltransferase [Mariprofundaceae bacterium]
MMRIVFAGTPYFSVAYLEALIQHPDMDVVGVVSQPDRQSGRGMKLTPSPVKKAALTANIDVLTPESLRDDADALAWLKQKNPDFLVVVAFGMILPKVWLDVPSIAPINVHASLLPRWRGAAPIERAFLAGDQTTGVCVMHMEEGLDTGGIYAIETCPITANDTGADLWSALSPLGAKLLVETLPKIANGLRSQAQSAQGMTYAKKISSHERVIDWNLTAKSIDYVVRCFAPKPAARTLYQGKCLKVLQGEVLSNHANAHAGEVISTAEGLDVACHGGGVYRIHKLQVEGKKAMQAQDFLRGASMQQGDILGI